MILNTLDNLGKFEAKGDEGYFIGYSMSSKAFRVFNKRTKRVEENLHVEFLENNSIEQGAGPTWLFDIDFLTKSMNYVPVDAGTNSTNLSGTKDAANQEPYEESISQVPEGSGNLNPTASAFIPPADQMETLTVESPISTISSPVLTSCLNDSSEPYSEARLVSKRVAIQEETPSLDNILSLTNRFDDILRVSTSSDEIIGVEADVSIMETSISASPTPNLRIHMDHPKMYQMDVKSAFLYGTIDEEVYVMQPPGFHDPVGTIYQTLIIRRQREDFILVQVYVDDIIFGSSNPQLCREFEALMHEKIQMGAMGELNFFIGLQVLQKEDGKSLGKDGPGKDVELYLYRSMIGSLMYLTGSRPDIMFAVYACARHQVTPKESSPYDLVAYSDSNYGIASQDRKSTTGGKYVAATSCCGQVLWIQNQLLDYGVDHIHTDENVADLLTKPFDAGQFQYLV
nr:hypothetical protein [Tanacetum cinerariifolium]